MLGPTPVLRVALSGGPAAFDLAQGSRLVPEGDATAVAARDFGVGTGLAGEPRFVRALDYDQWTMGVRGRSPLHQYAWDDARGTQIYVSSGSGEVLQHTTRHERFWNWLGAVPHWLYPTVLRSNDAVWTQVVIWLSAIGVFLTVLGLWLGIERLRHRRHGRWSPYRGLWEWHHVGGVVFGLVTLTWVLSGLLSMSPWGLLESVSGPEERRALTGEALDWRRWNADFGATVARIREQLPGAVELRSAQLAGQAYIVAATARGERRRFDVRGEPAPLSRPELERALDELGPRTGPPALLDEGDDYFYRAKPDDDVPLPVWRAVLMNAGAVHVYVDPVSGQLLRAVDGPQRGYRWWHSALHSLDFHALRTRPLWDALVLLLLAGATVVTVSGAWLSIRVLRR
jgi:hypothetical protein